MALGTPTVQADAVASASKPVFMFLLTFTGDTSYPTGGTVGFEAYCELILQRSLDVLYIVPEDTGALYTPVYDRSADALMVYTAATGTHAQVTNATNLSATTFNVWVIAR